MTSKKKPGKATPVHDTEVEFSYEAAYDAFHVTLKNLPNMSAIITGSDVAESRTKLELKQQLVLRFSNMLDDLLRDFDEEEMVEADPVAKYSDMFGSNTHVVPALQRIFPYIDTERLYTCPACFEAGGNTVTITDEFGAERLKFVPGDYHKSEIFNIVMHLNDVHKWSRERVADWLEVTDENISVKED